MNSDLRVGLNEFVGAAIRGAAIRGAAIRGAAIRGVAQTLEGRMTAPQNSPRL